MSGNLKGQFFAYNSGFSGGVNLASGDVDGDGQDEIITGAGPGGGPHVRIFDGKGKVQGQFFAYKQSFRGGIKIAVANFDGSALKGKEEIVTAPGKGGSPHVRIFDDFSNLKGQFFAYDQNFRDGVNLNSKDVDNDGIAEIITGAGSGGSPHVRIFDSQGKIIDSFYAYNKDFSGGVNVDIIKIKN